MFEMMDLTAEIAKIYNTTPFDVLEREADHVIMVINYVVEKSEDSPKKANNKPKASSRKNDGFWDF